MLRRPASLYIAFVSRATAPFFSVNSFAPPPVLLGPRYTAISILQQGSPSFGYNLPQEARDAASATILRCAASLIALPDIYADPLKLKDGGPFVDYLLLHLGLDGKRFWHFCRFLLPGGLFLDCAMLSSVAGRSRSALFFNHLLLANTGLSVYGRLSANIGF